MSTWNPVRLGRTISHALRHAPEAYGLTLAEGGWVSIDDLLAGIQRTRRKYGHLARTHLDEVIAASNKTRYEINGDRIRAVYGHSTTVDLQLKPATPPATLYHGTTASAYAEIQRSGLRPMARNYVHLSTTIEMAIRVGARRTDVVVLLALDTAAAREAGVQFYLSNDVWLADTVPAEFLKQVSP